MSRVVLLALSGFVAGIWLASLFAFVQDKYFVGLILLIALVFYTLSKIEREKKNFYLRASIFALFIALGLGRYLLTIPKANLLEDKIGQKISLVGVITGEPDEREGKTYLRVSDNGSGEKILATVPVSYTHLTLPTILRV